MDRRVALMSGREAVSIDVASRRSTLDDGKVLSFDRLVLAIGATAREFSTSEGIESVFTLHIPDDARQLRAALAAARSVLIITGGYIGRKILATLTSAGKKSYDNRGYGALMCPVRQSACLSIFRGAPS